MFDDFELSPRDGKPVHLFAFTRQNLTWLYASGDRDITVGGVTYFAAPIERSEIKQTLETAQDQITITFPYVRDPGAVETPATQSLGDNWRPYIPSDTINVVCMAYHVNDPDAQTVVEWMGQVSQPKFTDGELELTCTPRGSIDNNKFQGPKWQIACWKTPYSGGIRGCNMDPANFDVSATLTAVNGLVVSAAEFATAPLALAGASLRWVRTDGVTERRSVMAHTLGSTDITLLYGAADLALGLAVIARPGCPRTWAACTARNQTIDYGGSVYKPVKNPYSGISMSWG